MFEDVCVEEDLCCFYMNILKILVEAYVAYNCFSVILNKGFLLKFDSCMNQFLVFMILNIWQWYLNSAVRSKIIENSLEFINDVDCSEIKIFNCLLVNSVQKCMCTLNRIFLWLSFNTSECSKLF